MHKILHLANARSLEFFRDSEALLWNLLMPILFIVAIAFTFGYEQTSMFKIAVFAEKPFDTNQLPTPKYIKYFTVDNLKLAQTKLEQHQVDLVIKLSKQNEYWYNPLSEKSDFLNQIFAASTTITFTPHLFEGARLRYIDWVFPGILAIHLMFSALYGVAFIIVRYRKNGYLKRLQATPLSAFDFLTAQIISRILVSTVILVFVYFSCMFLLHPVMKGNILTLFILYISGAFCLISLALFVCARVSSEELSRGLLEGVAWPMLLISGAWFNLDQAHVSLQWFSQILPLTHLINAARAIMLNGAGLMDIKYELMLLLAMGFSFLIIASVSFKWRQ